MSTASLDHAKRLIEPVCRVAGLPSLIDDFRNELIDHGLLQAIDQHDSAAVYDWLAGAVAQADAAPFLQEAQA